jgi:hypothetical protein
MSDDNIKEFGKTTGAVPPAKKKPVVKGWPPNHGTEPPHTTYTAPAQEYDTKVITPTTTHKADEEPEKAK